MEQRNVLLYVLKIYSRYNGNKNIKISSTLASVNYTHYLLFKVFLDTGIILINKIVNKKNVSIKL